MSTASQMQVTLRLPTHALFEGYAKSLTAVAEDGAFGLLPNHIDFVTALIPSVLTLILADDTERFFGLDSGVLVKKGHEVDIAVQRGVQDGSLAALQNTVRSSFEQMDDEERIARVALSRLEANMVRRLGDLRGSSS